MCSKICGSIVLFCTLLQQNTVLTCKHEIVPHAMPPKKLRAKLAPASPGQGPAGGRPQPEHASGGDGGPSLSPVGPSLGSDSSVSPEKAGRRGHQSKKRVTDAGAEGSSWKGQSAVGALSFAQVSSGRGAPEKPAPVKLSLNSVPAAPSTSALKATAALNASSAPSQKGQKFAPLDAAAASPGHDQQTQDAAGQEAAPRMLFQVRTGTCHVDGVCVWCVCFQFCAHCQIFEPDSSGAACVFGFECSVGCLPTTAVPCPPTQRASTYRRGSTF